MKFSFVKWFLLVKNKKIKYFQTNLNQVCSYNMNLKESTK